MLSVKENRSTRFSIRATESQKDLIERAARRNNQTISEFVLENSIGAAEAMEMDNANVVLSGDDYDAFLKKLDESPRSIPALRQLLLDPTSIDVPNN